MLSTSIKSVSNEQLQQLTARVEAAAGQDMPFLTLLIELQAHLVGGQSGAVFVIRSDAEPRMVTVYPMAADGHVRVEPDRVRILRDCVERCRKAGTLKVYRVGMGHRVYHAVCTPLILDGRIDGVTVVMVAPQDNSDLAPHLAHLEWSSRLYSGHVAQRKIRNQMRQAAETRQALSILGAAHQAAHFQECALGICNELAAEFGAERVSLGWATSNSVRLVAISDTETLDRRQELSQNIETAMEECFDQAQAVIAPTHHLIGEEEELAQVVSRCHRQLIGDDDQGVCSIPLRYRDMLLGVLTVQRLKKTPFDGNSVSHLQAIADLVSPRLYDRDQNDRAIWVKLWQAVTQTVGRLVGPQHVGMKLVGLLVIAALIYACVAKWDYRIHAEFEFEPTAKRVYSAPFEGIIESVSAREGMDVEAGQELARLDGRDIEKRLATIRGELQITQTARREALGRSGLSAQASRLKALSDAREAEVKMYEDDLARATIRADEPGLVLFGDWAERRGTRVELGKPLFEVSRGTKLRVRIHVDERDIDHVRQGSRGELAAKSEPGQTMPFEVTRIVPFGQIAPLGQRHRPHNVFAVFGEMDQPPSWIKPGMKGTAKIDSGRARMIWIITHKLVDYLRLAFWW